jgi:hypothetical protein
LLFDRGNGHSLCLHVGMEFRVNFTPTLEQKLSRWLLPAKTSDA